MNRESKRQDENREREEFRAFLRTGSRIEVKFNPYHDPRDGRFTFAPEVSAVLPGDIPSVGMRQKRTRMQRGEEPIPPIRETTDSIR